MKPVVGGLDGRSYRVEGKDRSCARDDISEPEDPWWTGAALEAKLAASCKESAEKWDRKVGGVKFALTERLPV